MSPKKEVVDNLEKKGPKIHFSIVAMTPKNESRTQNSFSNVAMSPKNASRTQNSFSNVAKQFSKEKNWIFSLKNIPTLSHFVRFKKERKTDRQTDRQKVRNK